MHGVESDPRDPSFGGFFRMVLPVPDHRVADSGKLNPDLILQSRRQRYPHQ